MKWFVTKKFRRISRKSFVGQLVLLVLGLQILFFGSFTGLVLPTATVHNLRNYSQVKTVRVLPYLPEKVSAAISNKFNISGEPADPVRFSLYVLLLPLSVFLGYVLGFPLAVIVQVTYLLLGLIGPHLNLYLWAGGGGFTYYQSAGFGYLLGMIVASAFVGWLTREQRNSWRQILSVLGGVLIIHAIGLLYLLGQAAFILIFKGDAAYLNWQPWMAEQVRNLSWYPLPYDLIFSLLLVGIASPFRWFAGILTAPDIGRKAKPVFVRSLEEAL